MVGVFIKKRKFGHREACIQGECMLTLELWGQKPRNPQNSGETSRADISLAPSEKTWPYQYLNIELPASRTVRQWISIVWAVWCVVLCYGSPRKQIQCQKLLRQWVLCIFLTGMCESCWRPAPWSPVRSTWTAPGISLRQLSPWCFMLVRLETCH